MRPDAPVQGDLIAGKYRVRSVLGRGRGTLVLADHTAFEQRVAIRIVTPSMTEPVEIAKFRREAKVLAKLGSEHVARILDVGVLIDGSSYLVRQYLEGTNLTSYIAERRMLPVDEAIGLILQATEAVAESHAYGVLVRELSPEDLFLAERSPGVRGGPRILKITDFGTAKLMREAKPSGPEDYTATTVLGLSPYASPEMLRRQRDVDGRTDIWSLAAILYEMLTGYAPFGKDPVSLAITISRDDPPPLDRYRRDVPREVEAAIRQALAKDKNARPADTHAFAASLIRFAPDDARHLMARIHDLAHSARARTGQVEDDAEEISLEESSELDDPPTDEVVIEPETQVGRPQDIVRGLPPPPKAEPSRARRPLQEKTEALGVSFVPSDPYRQSNHAFAGAAAGLEPAAPVRASTPAPAPNAGRSPSQPGFPRIVPPAVASQMGARGSSPPPAQSALGMPGNAEPTQLGFGNVVPAEPFPQPSYPPPAVQQGAYPPLAGNAWMTSPGLVVPQAQPNAMSNGRKIAMFAIGGALAAMLILVVVMLALPAPAPTKASASSESTTEAVARSESAKPPPPATADPPQPSQTATAEPAATETAAGTASAASTVSAQPTGKPIAKPTATPSATATATASAAPKGDTGTLVVVVVGGTCTITVNGQSKGTTNSLKLSVAPGSYAVTCKPSTGQAKSNTVLVKADHSAMAMFNLN